MLALLLSLLSIAVPPDPSAPPPAADALPMRTVDSDDTVITESCRLLFTGKPIVDARGDGVVRIEGDGIVVDLGGTTLRGADRSAPADAFEGTGVVVTGKGVTLRNGAIRGFRCGVLVRGSDGSTFEKLDCSDNYATRLRSGSEAEDAADWLWPHDNDGREWVLRYGAGIAVERSKGVTLRDITVRRTQNGILLDRVTDGRIYDNDCSFLSGWGLALWRSSNNTIARNAFDFCIRGYSHGTYNRGQDSAGILLFEQCSDNTIALNSATHGGDGLFGFAGKEALGERLPAGVDAAIFVEGRGCNRNIIVGNDFSFAAAHGLEMTFSFGNVIALNRFEGNGICGVWGGYSRDSLIARNTFIANGGGRGPGEGGGIDIEHGQRNRIIANEFRDEGVAIELWSDDDPVIARAPWAARNGSGSADNEITGNRFVDCSSTVLLRESRGDREADHASGPPGDNSAPPVVPGVPSLEELRRTLPGLNDPIGKRRALGGREAIRMTAFGPWDGHGASLVLERASPDRARWKLLGAAIERVQVIGGGPLRTMTEFDSNTAIVFADMPGFVMPYQLRASTAGGLVSALGCIVLADWRVAFFPSTVDPRKDLEGWRAEAESADSVVVEVPAIDFPFGQEGPGALKLTPAATETLAAATLPKDHFGTIARATVAFPKGTFTIRVTSDDGVRVLVDGKTVLEDWTWHAPREARGTVTFDERKTVEIVVEHFELDGFSTLSLFIDGELDPARQALPRS